MEESSKLNIILIVLVITGMCIGVFGLTYSWFSAKVKLEEIDGSVLRAKAWQGIGGITFKDGNVINIDAIFTGTSISKTFTIERDSMEESSVGYKIILDVDTNTLTPVADGQFVYTLTGSSSGSGTVINKSETIVPVTSYEIGNYAIIFPGEVHSYECVITLKENDSDQRSTMGTSFLGSLRVEQTEGYSTNSSYFY